MSMPSTKSERKSHLRATYAEVVSVDEAVDLHGGEWIAMRVTSFGEKNEPLAGVVVEHSANYSRVCHRLSQKVETGSEPEAHYYLFLGEPRGHTGEDLRRQLEELAALEEQRHAWEQ